MKITINIAEEFTRSPAGRHISDGPFSGEKFRQEFLLPALQNGSDVEVNLSGTLGFGSSFLEEAFGGLVRYCGLLASDLKKRLNIISPVKTYEQRIWRYINEAAPDSRR